MSIFKKVVNVPVDAGKKVFNFADRKLTESNIRSDARYAYYSQLPSDELEKLYNKAKRTRERVSINEVMRKRGYKYMDQLEIYNVHDVDKVMRFEDEFKRQHHRFKSYKMIEAELKKERLPNA